MHIGELEDGLLFVKYAENPDSLWRETKEKIEAHLKICARCREELGLHFLLEKAFNELAKKANAPISEGLLMKEWGMTKEELEAWRENGLEKITARLRKMGYSV